MRRVIWNEPDGDRDATRSITPEEAVLRMAHIKKKHPEATDEMLLEDFCTIHGAWLEEDGRP